MSTPSDRSLPRDSRITVESSELLHRGHVFDVLRERIRLPSGLAQDLDVVVHGGAVAMLPVTEQGAALLVRQYRHALGAWTLEIPAGRLEPGEDPAAAARRELEEETGRRAGRWTDLGELVPAPGFCSERLWLFAAHDLEEIPGGGLAMDEDEEIELVELPLTDLAKHTRDAKTLVAAALLAGTLG